MKKSPKVKEVKSSTQSECYTKVSRRETGWYSWNEKTLSEAFLETLINELFEWADTNEGAIKLRPFFRKKKIFYEDVCYWRKKSKTFDQIYTEALAAIGDRREDRAFNLKANASIQMKTAHLYDPEWREVNRYHSDMKKDEEGSKKQPINLIVNEAVTHELVDRALADHKKI